MNHTFKDFIKEPDNKYISNLNKKEAEAIEWFKRDYDIDNEKRNIYNDYFKSKIDRNGIIIDIIDKLILKIQKEKEKNKILQTDNDVLRETLFGGNVNDI